MKIFFFIALLINIIFFLWEFNSGGLNSSLEIAGVDRNKTKQILLVSELSSQGEENSVRIAENNRDLNAPLVSLELGLATDSKAEGDAEESSQHLVKNSDTSMEEFSERLIVSDDRPQNDKVEQNTLQHDADIIASGDQADNMPVNAVLEEKSLNVERQEEVVVNNLSNSDESNVEQAELDTTYCYHVGPFADSGTLDVWRKLNEIDADSVNQLNKESQVVSSYLVYYPAAETYAQSRKNVQLLKQKGITDYWLFRKGELKGAISLGLFVKKKGALLLQEKLVKAGLTAEIKERYKTEQLLYAEILTEDKAFKNTVVILGKQVVFQCEN